MAAPPSPRRAWWVLAALSLLFFHITAATFTSLGVVLPRMVSELRWSWSDAGLGFTLLAVTCGLASLAPALVIRTLGVRIALLLGGLLLGVGLLLFAAGALPAYYLGAVLAGVGFALAAIIPGAFVLARAFPQPALAMGIYFTVGGLGGAAGPLLAHLGATHDWRSFWIGSAAISLILAALAAAAVAEPWSRAERAEPRAGEAPIRTALRHPAFWVLTLAYTVFLLVGVTVNYVSVEHLSQHGFTPAAAAGLLAAENLLNAVSRAAGGWAGERLGAQRLTWIGLVALAVGALALAYGGSGPLAILYVVGAGLGYGVAYLATPLLLLGWFGQRRNLELFSLMCLISTAAAAGPWLAGLSKDRLGGFAPALIGFAVLALATAAAVALMRPPKPEAAPPSAEDEARLVAEGL